MNLVEKALSQGGKIGPLIIPDVWNAMNPSVFVDDDGEILVNVRTVNYALYHAEGDQHFPGKWGPLTYMHPEKDQRLVTTNYIASLDSRLQVKDYCKVNTSSLDVEPKWEFVGLEDCRLVKWENEYLLIGVRRDTTTNGVGRMEYSHIALDKGQWSATETKRVRLPAPEPDNSYCEKNWMPIVDKPYHLIKWTMPTEIVHCSLDGVTTQVSLRETPTAPADQRGSSHVIRWGQFYLCITHEVNLFKNYLGQKDAIYRHRVILFDHQLNFVGHSQPFSFMDARIEFCVGAAVYGEDLLVSFGYGDNAAYVLQVPKLVVEDLILECL